MLRRCAFSLAAALGALGAAVRAPADPPDVAAIPESPAKQVAPAAFFEPEDLDAFFPSSLFSPNRAATPTPEMWSFDGHNPYVQRFSAGYDAGDGIGYRDGFGSLEWMTPITGDSAWDILFGDGRFLIRNDGMIGGNLGLGYRWYNQDWNRVFGFNGYFDYRDTGTNEFCQLGVGFESLGAFVDFRANAYIPDVDEVIGEGHNAFTGHLLILHREIAMTGGDAEVGFAVWNGDRVQGRVFGGGYYFDGQGAGDTGGWRVRGEADVDQQYHVDFSVQHDQVFGTTATVGVALRYLHRFLPPWKQTPLPMDHKFHRRSGDSSVAWRLGEPVERLQNIVIHETTAIATDPGGTPLNFLHVVEGGAGTGTIEDPYGTLSAAMADAAAGTSVIYTPHGGDYIEDVTFVPGATLLSNGPQQFVNTQFGLQRLPGSGVDPALDNLPTVTGNVVLANDTRFSGFDVIGQVRATGATNVAVDRSRVTYGAGDAMRFVAVDGLTLDTLTVNGVGGRGIFLSNTSAALRDVTIPVASDDGIQIQTFGTDRMVSLVNLTVGQAGVHGVDVNLNGAGSLDLSLRGVNTIAAADTAIDVATAGGSTGDLLLVLNNTTVSSDTGAGANIDGTAGTGTIFITEFSGNVVTAAATGGILADTVTFDADPTTAAIDAIIGGSLTIGSSTTLTNVKGDGLRLLDPSGDLTIERLGIFNSTGTGLLVDTKGGGTTFHLATGPGSAVSTAAGPALNLDPLDIDLVFDSVTSTASPTSGIVIDTVSGNLTISATTITTPANAPVSVVNSPALDVDLGTTSF